MYRGETITTTITGLPVPIEEIAELYLVFKTATKVLLEKTLADCTMEDETISVKLTQAESLSLTVGTISRHIVILTKGGSRFERKADDFECGPTAKDVVLGESSNIDPPSPDTGEDDSSEAHTSDTHDCERS